MSAAIFIFSGGGGLRLWPSSRENLPKQFLKISNSLSTFQISILRAIKLTAKPDFQNEKIFIITNIKYKFISENQIKEIGINLKNIMFIFEPASKNTLPSAIIACLVAKKYKIENIIIFSCDNYISDENLFIKYIVKLSSFIKTGYLGIFGIKPTSANTGYGYIEIDSNNAIQESIYKVKKFIEKPRQEVANGYFNSGKYFWNSGIFILNVSCFLEECTQLEKYIFEQCCGLFKEIILNDNPTQIILPDSFNNVLCKSIDHGIIEKSSKVITYLCEEIGWIDIGDWNSFYQYHQFNNDKNNNIIELGNTNCHIQNNHSSLLLSTIDLQDINIIIEQDAILVVNKNSSYKVKQLVEKMTKLQITQANIHPNKLNSGSQIMNMLETSKYKISEITIFVGCFFILNSKSFDYCKIISGEGEAIIGKKRFKILEGKDVPKNKNKECKIVNLSKNKNLVLLKMQCKPILIKNEITINQS